MQSNSVYPGALPTYNQYGIQQQEKGAPPHPDDQTIARIKEEARADCCCCSVFTWIRVLSILSIIGICLYALRVVAAIQSSHKVSVYLIVVTIGYLLLAIATLVNAFCLHRWIIYQIIAAIQIFFLMMKIAGSVIVILTIISMMAATEGANNQAYGSAIAQEAVSTLIEALVATIFIYFYWQAGKCQKKADGYPF